MTAGGAVSASDATSVDVLNYLDADFAQVARGVADARYTLWLGSGISLDRVEGLKAILLRALGTLHADVEPGNDDCVFRRSLEQILALSGISDERLASIDQASDPATWPKELRTDVLNGLAQNYSKVLDVRVHGKAPDFLLWEVIDVRTAYAQDALEPDVEHLAVALLALEGAAPEIATANWDGLIEKAFAKLGHPEAVKVCVCADDLEGPAERARLIKFHGCAIRASTDENTYRPMLIHQAHQIVNYRNNQTYRAIRNELVSQATTRPTLMIGLSAQDTDIQAIFADAADARTWPYPADPPAYVFAENTLGADQGTILRSVYGSSFDSNALEVEAKSVIRAYAKPLLTGLVLHVLCQKLRQFAKRCDAPTLTDPDLEQISMSIDVLRDVAAEHVSSDPLAGMLRISELVTNAMSLFRTGSPAAPGGNRYWPLTTTPLHAVGSDDDLPTSGLPEMAVSLGLIGGGSADGSWTIGTTSGPGALQLTNTASGSAARVFFCASGRAAVGLEESGSIDSSDDDVVVIHSDRVRPSLPRSPRSAPGRTGRSGPRHVGLADLLTDVASVGDLRLRFREEAGL